MSKKIIKYFIKIGIIVLILVAFILIINLTFGIILPLINLPMYVGTNIEWLNFIAIFLGSSLTLLGVYWQLNKTKEHHEDELNSNTKATYELLNNEVDKFIYHYNDIFKMDEIINFFIEKEKTELKKTELKEKTKISRLEFIRLQLKKSEKFFLLNNQVIYSYITLSTPNEKVKLLKLTSELSSLTNEIKELIGNMLKSDDGLLEFNLEKNKLKENTLEKLKKFKIKVNLIKVPK